MLSVPISVEPESEMLSLFISAAYTTLLPWNIAPPPTTAPAVTAPLSKLLDFFFLKFFFFFAIIATAFLSITI